jgi:hypothetical protein
LFATLTVGRPRAARRRRACDRFRNQLSSCRALCEHRSRGGPAVTWNAATMSRGCKSTDWHDRLGITYAIDQTFLSTRKTSRSTWRRSTVTAPGHSHPRRC